MTVTPADASGPHESLPVRVERLERTGADTAEAVQEIKDILGAAPDASTGRPGSGVLGVVSQLATKRNLMGASAAGAGGGVGIVWAIVELLRAAGVF